MKNMLVILFVVLLVSACKSNDVQSQTDASVSTDVTTETSEITLLTDEATLAELAKAAKFSEFTLEELKAAAKVLGFRCEMYKPTGSRIKKKVCTTKLQRDKQTELAKDFMHKKSDVEGAGGRK